MDQGEGGLKKQELGNGGDGAERTRERQAYIPLVDIIEKEDAMLLVADMPGVAESGVDITIEKNTLTLRATLARDFGAGANPVYTEFGVGDYERVFSISSEVDRDNVQATIKNGVLRLTLPKSKQALARKVTVSAG